MFLKPENFGYNRPMDIISWVEKYGDQTFATKPPCDIDYGLLAILSYLDFGPFMANIESNEMISLSFFEEETYKFLAKVSIEPAHYEKLIPVLFNSKRYSYIPMGFFKEHDEKKDKIQYASLVFKISDDEYVVSYRGTDLKIYGWEEDFLMAIGTVKSQTTALDYLKDTLSSIPPKAKVTLVGHSKGGALAAFVAFKSSPEVQDRIKGVYDYDGPGFNSDIFSTEGFLRIKDRYHKFLPKNSLIGLVMNDYKGYKAINAHGPNGLYQHSLFTWDTAENGFLEVKDLMRSAKAFDKAFDEWLEGKDTKARTRLIKNLFGFLEACGIHQMTDLEGDFLTRAKLTARMYQISGKKGRERLFSDIQALMKIYLRYFFSKDL